MVKRKTQQGLLKTKKKNVGNRAFFRDDKATITLNKL